MTASNHHQSDFRGGEIGSISQGRSELPIYRTALNLSLNQISLEEGSVTRRSGTHWLGPTYGRTTAKLLTFKSTSTLPYVMEFTNGNLQFYSSGGYVCTNDRRMVTASSSAAGALSLTLDANSTWSVGDTVILQFPSTLSPAKYGPYLNRVFKVTAGGGASTALTLKDDLGIALPYDSATNDLVTAKVWRIKRFSTAWTTTMLPDLRAVQAQSNSFILHKTVSPRFVQITTEAVGANDPVFTLSTPSFTDGPYLDQQGTFAVPETGTVSGYTGIITFTPLTTTFTAADVGRHIRLFSEPPAWNSGTTYTYGQTVTYKGAYWKSIATGTYAALNVGVQPGTSATSGSSQIAVWAAAPKEGQWGWGVITAQAGTSCTVQFGTLAGVVGLNANNGATISIWRLGVYMAGQYPTCGLYHEGRLWLAGAIPNRFDASISNDVITFSPTDAYGNVLDSSGIGAVINADDVTNIYWMAPDHQGILIGTPGGEWLISASSLNDPLTATSIQVHKITRYGAANIPAIRVGVALLFVQGFKQRILEYLSDTFSGRFTGRHINEHAKHLTAPGVVELAYQEEKAPIVWALMTDGTLAGTTYRRVSHVVTEDPTISGGHRHQIGLGDLGPVRLVRSMCVQANAGGLSDLLYLCTYAPSGTSDYAVEVLQPIFEDA